MRTLRTIGEFVGIPQDSPEFGAASRIGLRLADEVLARTGLGRQRSLRAIGTTLETLTAIDLQAALQTASGVDPFELVVTVGPSSGGLVISTYIYGIQNGRTLFVSPNYGSASGDFRPTQLGPGHWQINVRRSGIGNSGYTRLERSFAATVSRADEGAGAGGGGTISLIPPHIDVDQSGPLNAIKFALSGKKFLPNQGAEGIWIRVVDGVNPLNPWFRGKIYTGSDKDGRMIPVTLGPIDTTLLARNGFGKVDLNFSAADSRKDPNSTPKNEPLWSNTVTLWY